jgi:S-DNA-T family DNA segregation ATPase FtsK/SpoIIIE
MLSQSSSSLLPENVKDFLRRRLLDMTSLSFLAIALYLMTIFLSYHSGDPSFNTAVDGDVHNLGGVLGAYTADFFLRWFGWSSFILIGAFGVWGIRLWSGKTDLHRMLRVLFLPMTLICWAMAFAFLMEDFSYAYSSSHGGIVGTVFAGQMKQIIGDWAPGFPLWGMTGGATLGAGILLLYTLGIKKEEYIQFGKGVGQVLREAVFPFLRKVTVGIFWFFLQGGRALFSFMGRKNPLSSEEEYDSYGDQPSASEAPSLMPSFSLKRSFEETGESGGGEMEKPSPFPFLKRSFSPSPEEEEEDPFPAKARKRSASSRKSLSEAALELVSSEGYQLPPLDLLQAPRQRYGTAQEEVDYEDQARALEAVLADFGVKGEIVQVHPGPVVTLYELRPAAGTKSSRVIGLADDIARSMSAVSARVAVVPGRNVIGIELPNPEREMVYLRDLLASEVYERHGAALSLALGKDIGGVPIIVDLARMPHLLVAGTTGSGKSVAINTMILSLLYKMPPDRCKFIMIDPKMLELSVYDGIPHLLAPVVTHPKKAIVALKWVVKEMENRYRDMSKLGVRNIAGYNTRIGEALESGEILIRKIQTGFDPESGHPIFENQPLDLKPLPLIVVIVDEMADLMLVAGKEIESAVQRLAQMARAAGIHLIMATQRPSVDVITGTIKANFPTRMSFQVTSKIDSRTILGEPGAEQLLGQGDMLFMSSGGRLMRIHGPYASDGDVEKVVQFLKQQAEPDYVQGVTEEEDGEGLEEGEEGSQNDPLYEEAVDLIRTQGKISTSFIQRHLQIGYNRAARIVDIMEKKGVISPANHVGKREIL